MPQNLKCRECVPPKRHPDCHSDCEDYLKWKKEWEEERKRLKNEHWLKTLI